MGREVNTRQILVDELVHDEGVRKFPYIDTVGTCTIGVGRNLTDKGLSSEEVFVLLDHDLDEAIRDLSATFPWFLALDVVRQRALVNLRFNLGPAGLRRCKRFLSAMATKNYGTAAAELRDSRWFKQVQASRSARVLHQIATGEEA